MFSAKIELTSFRKIAVLESNNTEDNDNLEMMTHVEGPIVDSLYDSALVTWGNELNPQLPSLNTPAVQGGLNVTSGTNGTNGQKEPLYTDRGEAREQHEVAISGHEAQLPEHMPEDPHFDNDLAGEITRIQSQYSPKPDESRLQAVNRKLNAACKEKAEPSGPEIDGDHAVGIFKNPAI